MGLPVFCKFLCKYVSSYVSIYVGSNVSSYISFMAFRHMQSEISLLTFLVTP